MQSARRNSSGRFASKTASNRNRSSNRSRKNRNRNSNLKVLQVTSPRQLRAAERLLEAGAGSLVLIWSPTCPHCHTYLPLWSELTKMSNGRTNMISIRSDVYPETSLAAKKDVSGVPTVLYVDAAGTIQEVEESRNMEVMSNIVKNGMSQAPVSEPKPSMAAVATNAAPGVVTEPSNLAILPGTSTIVVSEELKKEVPEQPANVQMGGNLGALIRTAGPAALLLGAYAVARSSGLSAPVRRRSGTRRRVRFSRRLRRRSHKSRRA